MKIKNLPENINVLCIKAESFPSGIKAAHEKLHSLFIEDDRREYFGISWMGKNNEIIYYAAAEEILPGEALLYGCDTFIIKKGDYCGIMLKDWRKTPDLVGITFQELLSSPDLDPDGYCLEIYHGESDMECLVKLKAQ